PSIETHGFAAFKECQLFKIDDLGRFYLDSMTGRAELRFRDAAVKLGTDVRLLEKASGLRGFWDPPDSSTFRPTPAFLDRQTFFDVTNDSPREGDPNFRTNRFLRGLRDVHAGSAVCQARAIPDPVPRAPDASPDGVVRGL